MILFCEACCCNHEFKPKDAERILYALVGMLTDAYREPANEELEQDCYPCLVQVLNGANDIEGYEEFADGCFVSKRHFIKNPPPAAPLFSKEVRTDA